MILSGNLSAYIDIDNYKGNHAMLKFEYHFKNYFCSALKFRFKKWCEQFNYAQRALDLLGSKPKKFILIPQDELIVL